FAMTMACLNERRINLKPHAATEATPANDHVCLLRDANVLRLSKETQRFFAALAADAALFHSPERNAQVADEPAIYPDWAGVDPCSHAVGAAQVLGPDGRREAVFDVIGVIDHFVFAVEGRDCYDGTENFFPICAAGNRQAGNDGWLEEITVAATFVRRF